VKALKKTKEWHSSKSKMGMGDYYGTGIKQKTAKIRENFVGPISMKMKDLKKPPKSLA
jgi:hypothetical protein